MFWYPGLLCPHGNPTDLPFIELANYIHAPVLTGNVKQFPDDIVVMTPAMFLESVK